MEFSGYMTINASNQGAIEGSSLRKGRENRINLFAFNHNVKLPFQSHRNIGNGPVVHEPLSITKEVDKSTPKLYQALVEKELLTEVKLEWFRFDSKGEENVYYQVILENAHLLSISPWTPKVDASDSDRLRFMEELTFAYEKITWNWGPDGDIAYQTDWRRE